MVDQKDGKQNEIITIFGNLTGQRKQLNLTFEVD
jgi:hypothetical protein